MSPTKSSLRGFGPEDATNSKETRICDSIKGGSCEGRSIQTLFLWMLFGIYLHNEWFSTRKCLKLYVSVLIGWSQQSERRVTKIISSDVSRDKGWKDSSKGQVLQVPIQTKPDSGQSKLSENKPNSGQSRNAEELKEKVMKIHWITRKLICRDITIILGWSHFLGLAEKGYK